MQQTPNAGLAGNILARTKCECHDCTQARWQMSGAQRTSSQLTGAAGQLQQAMQQSAADVQREREQRRKLEEMQSAIGPEAALYKENA